MQRIIIWSSEAETLLDLIYNFYCKKSPTIAFRLRIQIIKSAEPLCEFPQIEQIEPALETLKNEYRYIIVEKHFKLIYTFTDTFVKIHTIWDCRQNTERLFNLFKDSEI